MEGLGAMPGNNSFCAVGFRCEVKWNVHQYVCLSVCGKLSGTRPFFECSWNSIQYSFTKGRRRNRGFRENRLGENRTSPKGINEFRYLQLLERLLWNSVYRTHNNSEFYENLRRESHTLLKGPLEFPSKISTFGFLFRSGSVLYNRPANNSADKFLVSW
jgi:hypothetical protein